MASDFLELSSEAMFIEIKLAFSNSLKKCRQALITRAELADKIHSSQPGVANAENGNASELLIQAILATGASPQEIGQVIASVG